MAERRYLTSSAEAGCFCTQLSSFSWVRLYDKKKIEVKLPLPDHFE